MWSYEFARDYAIAALRKKAEAEEQGHPVEVWTGFDVFDSNYPRNAGSAGNKLHIVQWFWDEWGYAADHHWETPVSMQREDWPRLARVIASHLEANEDITDPAVLSQFGYQGP